MKYFSVLFFLLISVGLCSAASIRLENDSDEPVFVLAVEVSKMADPVLTGTEDIRDILSSSSLASGYIAPRASRTGFVVPALDSWLLVFTQNNTKLQAKYLKLPSSKTLGAQPSAYIPLSSAKILGGGNKIAIITLDDLNLNLSDPRTDGLFSDWLGQKQVFRADQSKLLVATRHAKGISEQVARAASWTAGRAGTDLDRFYSSQNGPYLRGMLSSFSSWASGTSVFIKLAKDSKEVLHTLEIPVWNKGGHVLLWMKGMPEAQIIGQFVWTGVFLEFDIDSRLLPAGVMEILTAADAEAGLSCMWQDGTFSETWDYGTMPLSQFAYAEVK